MSEPMTSGEIEDVLSSIRKLVSEDLRPQPRVAASLMAQASVPDAGKLLLTPALRVVEGTAEAEATLAAAETSAADTSAADIPEPEPTRRLRLDTVVAAFAARVSPPADGWEAETGDATVTRLVRTPVLVLDGQAPVEPFPDATAEDDTAEGLGVTEAEIVDAVPTGRLHFAWQAGRADPGDDDGSELLAGEPLPEAEVLQGAEDAPEAPMLDLDSDALADMVRDILREELQGALGERMTRNIRRMVRAEVARILTTKDLA